MKGVRKVLVGLAVVATLLATAGPAFAYQGDDGDGGGYGSGYDDGESSCYEGDGYCQQYDQNYGSRDDRNRNRNRNRGAFSPGPFDRSPVDFSNSCISLDCSGRDDGKKKQPPARSSQGERANAAQRPNGFITDPRKIVEFPITIVEMSFDFAQKILKLVV